MTASDIITYIGVPLAVVGVIPILAVAIKTLLFYFRIRSTLRRNLDIIGLRSSPSWLLFGASSTIASPSSNDGKVDPNEKWKSANYVQNLQYYSVDADILLGQVTLSYPALRVEPLPQGHRFHGLVRSRERCSRLKGGSWSILYFQTQVIPETEVEARTYVLKPLDVVCQRPARVRFETLVRYLLGLGAVAEAKGWEELWRDRERVVKRTVLLKTRGGKPVLVVRKQEEEEDDRLFAVGLEWDGVNELQRKEKGKEKKEEVGVVQLRRELKAKQEINLGDRADQPRDDTSSGSRSQAPDPTLYRTKLLPAQYGPIDVEIDAGGLKNALWTSKRTGEQTLLDTSHLPRYTRAMNHPASWFSSVAVFLRRHIDYTTTDYVIPISLFNFAQAACLDYATIPCGVLYRAGLVQATACLPWVPSDPTTHTKTTQNDPKDDEDDKDEEEQPFDNSFRHEHNQTRKTQTLEALASPKWTVNVVNKYMLIWIKEHFFIGHKDSARVVAEHVLYRMLRFPAEAEEMGLMLGRWYRWYSHGMKSDDVKYIAKRRTTFALASCLLHVVGRHTELDEAKGPKLVDEGLRRWVGDVVIY